VEKTEVMMSDTVDMGSVKKGMIEFRSYNDDYSQECCITMKCTGEFIVNGRLVETDREIYEGFKQFLEVAGYSMPKQGEPEKVTTIRDGKVTVQQSE
jgi:hypothetical protein